MHLLFFATAVAVASVLSLPLLIITVPSAVFRLYLPYIPVGANHPHVGDSVASISEIRTAVLCILPPYISMSILCPRSGEAPPEDAPPFELFMLSQQTVFEASARYGPTPDAIASLSLLAQATEPRPFLGYVVSLLDGDSVDQVEDTRLLDEVASLSTATAKAYYGFLVQYELSVFR